MVLGGPALYLLGENLFQWRMTGKTNTKRLTVAVLLILLVPLAGHVAGLLLGVIVTALLAKCGHGCPTIVGATCDTLKAYLSAFEAAGADEVICFPASADPAHVGESASYPDSGLTFPFFSRSGTAAVLITGRPGKNGLAAAICGGRARKGAAHPTLMAVSDA
jgi:hypothetical protein